MTKLVTDPARQAHDALRGYIYQVVRSVLAWIDLGDGEELYLEGAEDLDRIGPDGARVDQIKYTGRRVTLRTASVVDAINNYWRHVKRNPNVKIRFRYLTTSTIGIERKRVTNEATPALEQWNRARLENSARSRDFVRALAEDLAARPSIDTDLRAFLAGASDASVREELVCRIEWHAGEKDSVSAIAEIKNKLVLHGASDGLQPADSEVAFDALYRAAFDAAQDKSGRALNRAEFLRVFAAATAIQIPKQDLAALIRRATAPGTASEIAIAAPTMAVEGSPPLPARYFRRRQIEAAVGRCLAEGTVLLHGATGTGKTLLAASLLEERSALWLTLRDFPPREAKARLALARNALDGAINAEVLVVDDLDALSDPREIESPLASLFNKASQLGIRMILTSDRPLPPRLAQAAELSTDREFVMAPFAQDEIAEFLRSAGCPEALEQAWSKILEAATMGHPQLLHVRISTLAGQAFPYPEARDLLGPTAEMDRVRLEARRLISALPDEARELLYRASLLTGRMQRQRLMAVGRFEPAIAETGHAIDILAGPWLEATDDGEFRVSPLARGSAEDARGQGWAKAMHRKLAWVYLIDRKLSPWDISSIVMHCVIGGRSDPLAHVLQGIHSAGDEAWAEIAEACDFYISLGLKDDLPTFERPVDSFLFRVFQYRIAAARKPEVARQIAAKIDGEFATFTNDEPFRYFRFLFLSQFLGADAIAYPLATIVDRGLEFVRLAAVIFPDTPTFPDIEDEDQPPRVYFLTLRLTQIVQDLDAMTELLEIIGPLNPDEAVMVLQALAPTRDLAAVLSDRLWLAEMRSAEPRWLLLCDVLKQLLERTQELGIPTFFAAVASTLIRTIDENVDDNAGALVEAERLASGAGSDVAYQCAMAVVIKNSGDIPRALDLWRKALQNWPPQRENLGYAFAARQAAIAAAKASCWLEARRYFLSALDRLDDDAMPTFVLGLKADSMLCRYMMGEHGEAIADFAGLLDELEVLQADYTAEPLRSVQRAIGGQLSALANPPSAMSLTEAASGLVGIPSFLEPLAGSENSPAVPLEFIRQHLIDLEARHPVHLGIALIQASKVRAARFRALRSVSQSPLFHLALRTGDFSEIVKDALDAADALDAMAESRARGNSNPILLDDSSARAWSPSLEEFPIRYLVAAMFGAAAADRLDDLPISRWRGDADAHPEGVRLRALIDDAEAYFISAAKKPWPVVRQPATGRWEDHALAALASTIVEPMTPDRLMACHGLWVHYLAQPVIAPLTGRSVAELVSAQWRSAAEAPAHFINPRIVIPRLRMATDTENLGWNTAHAVLSVALEGLRLPLDDPARKAIAGLAAREQG